MHRLTVAARAPDAGGDYTALAKTYPTPPASAGILQQNQLPLHQRWRLREGGCLQRPRRASNGTRKILALSADLARVARVSCVIF